MWIPFILAERDSGPFPASGVLRKAEQMEFDL